MGCAAADAAHAVRRSKVAWKVTAAYTDRGRLARMKSMNVLGVVVLCTLGVGCGDDGAPPENAPDAGAAGDAGPKDDGTLIQLDDGPVRGAARAETRAFIG